MKDLTEKGFPISPLFWRQIFDAFDGNNAPNYDTKAVA
jgi:hypothetical protein